MRHPCQRETVAAIAALTCSKFTRPSPGFAQFLELLSSPVRHTTMLVTEEVSRRWWRLPWPITHGFVHQNSYYDKTPPHILTTDLRRVEPAYETFDAWRAVDCYADASYQAFVTPVELKLARDPSKGVKVDVPADPAEG